MQLEDLVSDNSSSTNENQGEEVQTASSSDQPIADNFGAVQESTPTLSTSASDLRTVVNVEQTQSFSSRSAEIQNEDHGQLDQQSMMFEATSVQVTGPTDTRASLSNNEQEMPMGEQVIISTSQVRQFERLLVELEQVTGKQSTTSQNLDFEELLVRFGQSVAQYNQLYDTLQELLVQLVVKSRPRTVRTLKHTQGTNPETTSVDNTAPSTCNKTNASLMDKGQQLQQTFQENKVLSLFKKFESFGMCLGIPSSLQLSPENESTWYKEGAVTSVISKQPTSIVTEDVVKAGDEAENLVTDEEEVVPEAGHSRQPGLASEEDHMTNDSHKLSQQLPAQILPSQHDLDMCEQSVVSAGLPPADDSSTEVVGEPQGHMVSDQPDQRPSADHPPGLLITTPLFDSAVSDLQTSRPAGEAISDEQPTDESTPVSDV